MHNLMKITGAGVCAVIVASCTTIAPFDLGGAQFTAAELAEDYDAFLAFVKTTHPNLEYSADLAALDAKEAEIATEFYDGMTVRDAWGVMALTNPVFGDAHIGLLRPVAALAAYEENGGKLFPAPVAIDGAGAVRIAETASAALGVNPGDEVLSINGISARAIIDHLAPRMRGETPALGRLLMARRFREYFWIMFGGYDRYVARVKGDRGARTVTLQMNDAAGQSVVKNPYRYERLNADVGYINVTTFEIAHKDQFQSFLESASAQIAADGVDNLVIDLRENGGGARDLSNLLMAYLTDQTYSPLSRITARITEGNIGRLPPGAELGGVVTLAFQQPVTPPAELENRFNGKTYALVGNLTYSQAIVFAATLQDHKIATIAGEETQGPANQTGQVQSHALPNTGLQALAPIYIFTRASGDTSRRGLIPDIAIVNDPLNAMVSVTALLEKM